MKRATSYNLVTYSLFLLVCVTGIYYGNKLTERFPSIRLWDITNVLLLIVAVPFLWIQSNAGLPDFWDSAIKNKRRFILPLTIGAVFGLLDVIVFQVLLPHAPYKELPAFTQPFPYSVFLYFCGAVEVEVFYRLIPLTILLFIGKKFKQGKYYIHFFWVAAVLTALREPLEQMPAGNLPLLLYSFSTGFLMNFLQAVWYRKAGFLASLFIRLGHYLIWHILLGIYIQFILLN